MEGMEGMEIMEGGGGRGRRCLLSALHKPQNLSCLLHSSQFHRRHHLLRFSILFSSCNSVHLFAIQGRQAGRGTWRSAGMAPRNGVKKQIAKDLWTFLSDSAPVALCTAATMVSSGANSSALCERSVITGTAADATTVVFAGAHSSSLLERSVTTAMSVGVLRTGSSVTSAERPVVKSIGILSPSLAAGVDKSLDAGPALTRSNPTASILVKVPSADFLKHEGSRLYKDEKGDWVADLVPESTAESDAYSTTQMMEDRIDRPTPIMV